MKKLLALMVTSVMLVTVLVGCAPDRTDAVVLATHGNNEILLRDFLYVFANNRAQEEMWLDVMGYTEEEILAAWEETGPDSSMQRVIDTSLEIVLDQGTLLRIALDAGYTYDPDELREREDIIDEIILRLHSPQARGEDIFFDFYRITPQDFKDMQRDMLTIEAFVDSVAASLPVSDEQVLEFYQENHVWLQQQFGLLATARHVLIGTQDMTEEERQNATELAHSILSRVQAGEDIGELAAIYSEDPGSAQNNGEYTFPRGMMVADFENWAFSAQAGDSGIVESNFGYHIMYSIGVDTIDDHLDDVRMIMVQEELHDTIMSMIHEADIQWNVKEDVLNSVTIL